MWLFSGLARALERWLLPLVLGCSVVGLIWSGPPRAAVAHHGVSVALIVLVASVGLSLPRSALAQTKSERGRVVAAVVSGALLLPLIAWAASRLVPAGPLQLGVLAAGVAPSEVAAVALTGLAGGQAAVSAAVLIGATLLSIATAGPILHELAGSVVHFSSTGLLLSLIQIVALPLALGAAVRAFLPHHRASVAEKFSSTTSSFAVLVLIWLVSGQAHLSAAYGRTTLALLLYLVASTLLGVALTVGLPQPRAVSILLPLAMRDFAIAAGIATAAFGPAAAAPLGIYGVLVLVLGAAFARRVGRRPLPNTAS